MRRVTPQRTAERRREAPTPTMAPVIVWVVLTGMPKWAVPIKGERTGGFGGEAAKGSELGDALTHGLDDAPATRHGAAAHGEVTADDDQ